MIHRPSRLLSASLLASVLACAQAPERHQVAAPGVSENLEGQAPVAKPTPAMEVPVGEAMPENPASRAGNGGIGEQPAPVQTPNTSISTKCHLGDFAIVNGQLAEADDEVEKSTVRVVIESPRKSGTCTGTIIGPRHIVTATHCIDDDEPTKVMLGRNRNAPDAVISVDKYVRHPNWNLRRTSRYYDTSVLLLKSDIPEKFKPVPVAATEELQIGLPVILAGFGRYSENDRIGDRSLTWIKSELQVISEARAILETTFGNGKGTCYGDSGGPMFLLDPQTRCLKLAGSITSASSLGDGSCDQGGDLMMDVTRYQGWMKCAFEKMGAPLAELKDDASNVDCRRSIVRKP